MDEQNAQESSFRFDITQGIGGIVTEQNRQNAKALMQQMHNINAQSNASKASVDHNLEEALKCIENVRDFVGDPAHILGSPYTKHGEIAEQVDVWFYNADRIMSNQKPDATFDGVGRTAPEDYLVQGIPVQSKYINGANNSLAHVIEHMEKYNTFGREDGSYYVIPKDQYELIEKALSGDASGISEKSVRAIREKINFVKNHTGRDLGDVIRPGNVDYASVQQGKIHQTLDNKDTQLKQTASDKKADIDRASERKIHAAQNAAKPSWQKAGKAAISAAAFSGVSQLTIGIYFKCKQGKKLSEFTTDDWKDIGLDTGKAAVEGGISGAALYGITNFTGVSSTTASAGIALAFSITELVYQRSVGHLSEEDFTTGCEMAAVNAAVSAVGAAAGQQLIPVPVLGAFIGSFIATKGFALLCHDGLSDALTLSAYEISQMTKKLEQGAENITRKIVRTHQFNQDTQTFHENTQTILNNFNRKKR